MRVHRVLVVDDDPSIRHLLQIALGDDYDVTTCGDTETADELFHADPPDAIVLDWMLPGKSGVDWLLELRADPSVKRVPVVMLTAKDRSSDEAEAMRAGADAYLTKPFNPELLAVNLEIVLAAAAAP